MGPCFAVLWLLFQAVMVIGAGLNVAPVVTYPWLGCVQTAHVRPLTTVVFSQLDPTARPHVNAVVTIIKAHSPLPRPASPTRRVAASRREARTHAHKPCACPKQDMSLLHDRAHLLYGRDDGNRSSHGGFPMQHVTASQDMSHSVPLDELSRHIAARNASPPTPRPCGAPTAFPAYHRPQEVVSTGRWCPQASHDVSRHAIARAPLSVPRTRDMMPRDWTRRACCVN